MSANRMAVTGDQVTGMAIMGAHGTLWAGEFHTTVGEGKVWDFLSRCTPGAVGYVYLILEDGTTVIASEASAHHYDN